MMCCFHNSIWDDFSMKEFLVFLLPFEFYFESFGLHMNFIQFFVVKK